MINSKGGDLAGLDFLDLMINIISYLNISVSGNSNIFGIAEFDGEQGSGQSCCAFTGKVVTITFFSFPGLFLFLSL